MTIGEIAGLIAAIAFVLLVIFIGIFLIYLIKTLKNVTNDVNALSKQTEDMLTDINVKLEQVDPLFKAVGQVGSTVSNVTETAQEVSGSFKKHVGGSLNKLFNLFSKKGK